MGEMLTHTIFINRESPSIYQKLYTSDYYTTTIYTHNITTTTLH